MGARMRRREFIGFVGSVGALPAFFWRHAAWAQQARRIAFVHSGIAADKLTETAGPFWVRRVFETPGGPGDGGGKKLGGGPHSAAGPAPRFAPVAPRAGRRKAAPVVGHH